MSLQLRTIEHRPIEALIPYAKNARTHSPEQVEKIAASIREFGWTNPMLVDDENGVIAGHGRLLAARSLGMATVPCLSLSGLSADQRRAYVLADNRLALDAGWNDELLLAELRDLADAGYDVALTGFDAAEIIALEDEYQPKGRTDPDDVPEIQPVPISKTGDVWTLGLHRVMCGDSTRADQVDVLMGGKRPDMVFTDPPYNIDYQGVKDKRARIENDKMGDPAFVDFLTRTLPGCETMYVCCSWQNVHLFRQAMEAIGRKPKAMIVWDKVNPAQHLDKYFKQHELVLYYGEFGGQPTLRGDVWSLTRQRNTVHPTMKPVELIEMALEDNALKKVVLDTFGGSGSTLIACEKAGRCARLMEIDPLYVDVIVRRWQAFTGLAATLENDGRTFAEVSDGR